MRKRTSKEIFAETMLELAERMPVNKITLKQLVAESGLSTKTFYNHFKDKYELMIYIVNSMTEQMHAKMKLGQYSFHDYILDGVLYYKRFRGFLLNAFEHTTGQDSFRKKHAEAVHEALSGYLLKRNDLTAVPDDIQFKLRLYAYGVDELFSYCYLHDDKLAPEAFVKECEDSIPSALKPYFL